MSGIVSGIVSGAVPALRVEGLRRSFGDKLVVDGIDLALGDAELLTLVGPSGCGKSTLLRLIAGLEPCDAGRVQLGDRDLTGVPPEQRRIGFVFQESSLFGHLRVEQNVAFGLHHLPRHERAQRVAEMLELVHLNDHARRYPHQLSGGEQQRVALARALAPSPQLVLLDEPFASLDEVLRDELRLQVADILRSTRTASILVTHDRHEAMALGDRVAVMRAGRLHQCDTPEAVYQRPADRFVAGFVDVASFLPDGNGVLVARPHQIAVASGGADTVLRAEFAGARYRYTVRRADGTEVIADGAAHTRLQPGDACTVHVVDTALHRLDAI
jgi:iron(III) transport system ATP-binding protein